MAAVPGPGRSGLVTGAVAAGGGGEEGRLAACLAACLAGWLAGGGARVIASFIMQRGSIMHMGVHPDAGKGQVRSARLHIDRSYNNCSAAATRETRAASSRTACGGRGDVANQTLCSILVQELPSPHEMPAARLHLSLPAGRGRGRGRGRASVRGVFRTRFAYTIWGNLT